MKLNRNSMLQIGALFGAVFMLVVSIGISVSIHYCNGRIVDFAVDARANPCEGYYELIKSSPTGCSYSKTGCCEDANWLLVVDNDAPPAGFSVVNEFQAIALFLAQKPAKTRVFVEPKSSFLAHAPPELIFDYQVVFQVFRI